jgi:hypothetical protein
MAIVLADRQQTADRKHKEESHMENLIPLLILGVFMYLIFFRRGGMSCCGSHGTHDSGRGQDIDTTDKASHKSQDNVIDLREGDYTILTPKDNKRPL